LIALRKTLQALAGQKTELFATLNEHVLGYVRIREANRLIVLANFSEQTQVINGNRLRTAGLGRFFNDMIQNKTYATSEPMVLEPYQILWLNRI
jgi:amylosucrase